MSTPVERIAAEIIRICELQKAVHDIYHDEPTREAAAHAVRTSPPCWGEPVAEVRKQILTIDLTAEKKTEQLDQLRDLETAARRVWEWRLPEFFPFPTVDHGMKWAENVTHYDARRALDVAIAEVNRAWDKAAELRDYMVTGGFSLGSPPGFSSRNPEKSADKLPPAQSLALTHYQRAVAALGEGVPWKSMHEWCTEEEMPVGTLEGFKKNATRALKSAGLPTHKARSQRDSRSAIPFSHVE